MASHLRHTPRGAGDEGCWWSGPGPARSDLAADQTGNNTHEAQVHHTRGRLTQAGLHRPHTRRATQLQTCPRRWDCPCPQGSSVWGPTCPGGGGPSHHPPHLSSNKALQVADHKLALWRLALSPRWQGLLQATSNTAGSWWAPPRVEQEQPRPQPPSPRICVRLSCSTAHQQAPGTPQQPTGPRPMSPVKCNTVCFRWVRSEARMSQRKPFSDWGRRQRGDLLHPKPGIDQQPRRRP